MTAANVDDHALLTRVYEELHNGGIGKLLLMRLFPVGRGQLRASAVPSAAQYRDAIDLFRNLEAYYKTPKIKLQCALKFFDPQAMKDIDRNPCDLMHESFGLTSNGILLASPWAINRYGTPLDEAWVLGNLATTPMSEILSSPKAQAYFDRLDDNFGHCKIFSFFNSKLAGVEARIFDSADPLYQSNAPTHDVPVGMLEE